MLAAPGLAAMWTYKKARLLAIFDNLNDKNASLRLTHCYTGFISLLAANKEIWRPVWRSALRARSKRSYAIAGSGSLAV
jgi:hypothetical protein